jgi:hypothetical protein
MMSAVLTHPAPADTAPRTPAAAPEPLSLDARLAAADAMMELRLETALLALAVDSAHVEQPVDLVDVMRVPVAVPQTPIAPTGTPVADLLRRAQARILRPGGWSRETGTNSAGGACLEYAMQAEALSDTDEREARIVLRHVLGSGDPIPHINRQLTGAGQAGQLLGAAAALAHARGI